MGEPQQLSGGELNAALTSEVVRIHTAKSSLSTSSLDCRSSQIDTPALLTSSSSVDSWLAIGHIFAPPGVKRVTD
jgi:hypothetical protein